jgi:hypothetical protein
MEPLTSTVNECAVTFFAVRARQEKHSLDSPKSASAITRYQLGTLKGIRTTSTSTLYSVADTSLYRVFTTFVDNFQV